jgi:hypothetical protein
MFRYNQHHQRAKIVRSLTVVFTPKHFGAVSLHTTGFNIQKFYMVLASR